MELQLFPSHLMILTNSCFLLLGFGLGVLGVAHLISRNVNGLEAEAYIALLHTMMDLAETSAMWGLVDKLSCHCGPTTSNNFPLVLSRFCLPKNPICWIATLTKSVIDMISFLPSQLVGSIFL